MAGLWNTCMAEWALREGVRCYIAFFLFSLFLEINRVALPAPPPISRLTLRYFHSWLPFMPWQS